MTPDDMRLFYLIAQTGSLTEAAKKAGISTPTIGRRMNALENHLGTALMSRGRDGVVLNPAGQALAKEIDPAIEAFDRVERIAARLRFSDVSLPVRISAPEPLITDILSPALALLPQDCRVEMLTSTAVVNLEKQEADLAIRLFRPKEDALIARRLPDITMSCFASEEYLNGRDPARLDLCKEKILAFSPEYGDITENIWLRENGLESAAILRSTSSRALIEAARTGAGIAISSYLQARHYDLIEVQAPPIPARQNWLVSHRSEKYSARLKPVKAWIIQAMKDTFSEFQ